MGYVLNELTNLPIDEGVNFYVFVVSDPYIDPLTKIIPVLHLGTRTQDTAHAVVHELHGRLASACLPVFTGSG